MPLLIKGVRQPAFSVAWTKIRPGKCQLAGFRSTVWRTTTGRIMRRVLPKRVLTARQATTDFQTLMTRRQASTSTRSRAALQTNACRVATTSGAIEQSELTLCCKYALGWLPMGTSLARMIAPVGLLFLANLEPVGFPRLVLFPDRCAASLAPPLPTWAWCCLARRSSSAWPTVLCLLSVARGSASRGGDRQRPAHRDAYRQPALPLLMAVLRNAPRLPGQTTVPGVVSFCQCITGRRVRGQRAKGKKQRGGGGQKKIVGGGGNVGGGGGGGLCFFVLNVPHLLYRLALRDGLPARLGCTTHSGFPRACRFISP